MKNPIPMTTSHNVLLLPWEFGNSYSCRWMRSMNIQIHNASEASPKMPRHE